MQEAAAKNAAAERRRSGSSTTSRGKVQQDEDLKMFKRNQQNPDHKLTGY